MDNIKYDWTDNPTESGVSPCNTDILNECLMHLKYNNEGKGNGLSLFDVVEKDHVLTIEESKGYAPLGSFVYKEAASSLRYGYPDFYNKCLEEKNDGTETELQLEDNTITVYKHSNGHVFYDIADKEVVDLYYLHNGACWMYGIDEENERIFLPRNDWFTMNGKSADVGKFIEAGLPNLEGSVASAISTNTLSGVFVNGGSAGSNVQGTGSASGLQHNYLDFDASASSSIYGNSDTVQPAAVKKLVYMVVGSTEVTSSIIDVTEITTSENDTIPLFTAQYFDFTPNNPSWLKAGEQKNSGGIYTTAYNTLVNCLTENTYNLKVVDTADMTAGIDYSEYWMVDQTNMTFTTPTKISYLPISADAIPVVGNGVSLGLMDGNDFVGIVQDSSGARHFVANKNAYGVSVGSSLTASLANTYNTAYGITTDPEKSGLIADLSGGKSTTAQLYFKVANAVQNLELLDVGEVLEIVTNKVSLTNTLWATNACMPDYDAGISITSYTSASNQFTAPCDGIIVWGSYAYGVCYINNIRATTFASGNDFPVHSTTYLLPKGAKWYATNYIDNSEINNNFFPLKGANND